MNSELVGPVLVGVILCAVVIWLVPIRSPDTTHRITLRNARLHDHIRFGHGTDASPGMVRMTLHADSWTVFDVELPTKTFLEHADLVARVARNIS
jgi:hypothetical protein